MKTPVSREAVVKAVAEMGAIPGFPQDKDSQGAIMRNMLSFIRFDEALRYVVDQALEGMTQWRGIPVLRDLHMEYCKRLNEEEEYQKFQQWKREAAALPAPEQQANGEIASQIQQAAEKKRLNQNA